MTDSKDNKEKKKVTYLGDTLGAAMERTQEDNPTKGVILYFSDDPLNPELEQIRIQFSGNMHFKDFTALQFALTTWIGQHYYE